MNVAVAACAPGERPARPRQAPGRAGGTPAPPLRTGTWRSDWRADAPLSPSGGGEFLAAVGAVQAGDDHAAVLLVDVAGGKEHAMWDGRRKHEDIARLNFEALSFAVHLKLQRPNAFLAPLLQGNPAADDVLLPSNGGDHANLGTPRSRVSIIVSSKHQLLDLPG